MRSLISSAQSSPHQCVALHCSSRHWILEDWLNCPAKTAPSASAFKTLDRCTFWLPVGKHTQTICSCLLFILFCFLCALASTFHFHRDHQSYCDCDCTKDGFLLLQDISVKGTIFQWCWRLQIGKVSRFPKWLTVVDCAFVPLFQTWWIFFVELHWTSLKTGFGSEASPPQPLEHFNTGKTSTACMLLAHRLKDLGMFT